MIPLVFVVSNPVSYQSRFMLRIKTTEVEGESFTIQQLSAFRVLAMEKKAKEAAADNAAAVEMIVDNLQRSVLVSEENPVPRYKTEADMDSLNLPQMIKLNGLIIEFSQEPADGKTLSDVESEIKN